ncbi:hypothetical protein GFC29_534 [Anoxybacillus sp. B7M1]|uniref:NAD(P)/FAD-dependent oxidoreductase n=2 Tax=Anoxybacteroides rupiense TaxID=311460 RepID=A0ABD5J1A8_9BACL|nr:MULTISPECIES: NAD(P)/FAD-dependent oxidoreductase [Anoxybacillus]ANB58127.1 hypothetical protein GFC28_1093 [Anoxybacillus sp. B2M1]ANB62945.1 hypothetical protein GFC29_534 [Anoxybacillus sp. B7M1]KXG10684.1 hypothetical protein AT864_01275 [Anoxybacillus sp. P3H1B]MBB3906024.1 putative flavoprotein YhiN [Anoxybacillus rupiensis]MDE8563252.1 NAD(P)/FAD-dependent oxidoreductase [Anoxybacillus rupiensis]
MKKIPLRVLFITIVLFFVSGGLSGAVVYHMSDAAEAAKKEYQQEINQYLSEKDMKIKNDLSNVTQSEIQRLQDETKKYLNEKLNQDYQQSLNQKTEEIKKVTDQKIEEIKNYIDQLLKNQ